MKLSIFCASLALAVAATSSAIARDLVGGERDGALEARRGDPIVVSYDDTTTKLEYFTVTTSCTDKLSSTSSAQGAITTSVPSAAVSSSVLSISTPGYVSSSISAQSVTASAQGSTTSSCTDEEISAQDTLTSSIQPAAASSFVLSVSTLDYVSPSVVGLSSTSSAQGIATSSVSSGAVSSSMLSGSNSVYGSYSFAAPPASSSANGMISSSAQSSSIAPPSVSASTLSSSSVLSSSGVLAPLSSTIEIPPYSFTYPTIAFSVATSSMSSAYVSSSIAIASPSASVIVSSSVASSLASGALSASPNGVPSPTSPSWSYTYGNATAQSWGYNSSTTCTASATVSNYSILGSGVRPDSAASTAEGVVTTLLSVSIISLVPQPTFSVSIISLLPASPTFSVSIISIIPSPVSIISISAPTPSIAHVSSTPSMIASSILQSHASSSSVVPNASLKVSSSSPLAVPNPSTSPVVVSSSAQFLASVPAPLSSANSEMTTPMIVHSLTTQQITLTVSPIALITTASVSFSQASSAHSSTTTSTTTMQSFTTTLYSTITTSVFISGVASSSVLITELVPIVAQTAAVTSGKSSIGVVPVSPFMSSSTISASSAYSTGSMAVSVPGQVDSNQSKPTVTAPVVSYTAIAPPAIVSGSATRQVTVTISHFSTASGATGSNNIPYMSVGATSPSGGVTTGMAHVPMPSSAIQSTYSCIQSGAIYAGFIGHLLPYCNGSGSQGVGLPTSLIAQGMTSLSTLATSTANHTAVGTPSHTTPLYGYPGGNHSATTTPKPSTGSAEHGSGSFKLAFLVGFMALCALV